MNDEKSIKSRKFLIFLTTATILSISGTYIGMRIWMRSDINRICETALSNYPGDKIEAMIHLLNSDYEPLDTKNKVIWALGKLNDQRALPVLKSLQTGTECDHTKFVCQRELEKAIDNLEEKKIDLFSFK